VIKNIRIKKRGGGTRMQRVEVLKSGKFKFLKNIKTKAKSGARRIKSKIKRKRTIKKKAPVNRSVVSRKGFASKITGNPILKKILMAAGAVTVATSVAAVVAPQVVPILQQPAVKAILGFVTGDIVGAISNFVLGRGAGSAITTTSNGGGANPAFA